MGIDTAVDEIQHRLSAWQREHARAGGSEAAARDLLKAADQRLQSAADDTDAETWHAYLDATGLDEFRNWLIHEAA